MNDHRAFFGDTACFGRHGGRSAHDPEQLVKNVQVIDGAVNCTYPIYAFSDELFS